ncbi:threonine-phosphate decarboxylase CobD [Paracoccus sp. Z330]|uniref:threonine-phosphate decarboxylase n=1 Tax=Paracoccus onchidii TaxID=3017813 RepID=A0ABT4ZH86_9RHOB|nr:threonine-phosphate decarboxylase CobD [Paracoccus onchidii]MDB6178624.1 threonine-phosphate decarboxylase CobD [Paracoccus onchidii]
MRRDHGGNIDEAARRYGGTDWIDLSTGINRRPWAVPPLPGAAWQALPTATALTHLINVAAAWFRCDPTCILPVAGASAAIQVIPRILPRGSAHVLSPSYNEHAASLRQAGWQVTETPSPDHMSGADLAVIVNPNNPDGREFTADSLVALAGRVGHLLVDESFADPRPDLSVAPALPENCLVLRSFGKFWGLAGLRLGFVIARPTLLAAIAERTGPWSVSGPALAIGAAAMADHDWADETVTYHSEACLRLDKIACRAGWTPVGGTHLFRLYDTGDALAAQEQLARSQIWSRRFPYSGNWLRLGIPGSRAEWARLSQAIAS